jgi:hypothetical protein
MSENCETAVMEVEETIKVDDSCRIKVEIEEKNTETALERVNKHLNIPEKYHEIYGSYKNKEFEKCLLYIEDVSDHYTEYQILKSACLIRLNQKMSEAHDILDKVLEIEPDNAFTVYAKGLAFYHEEKWEDSLESFKLARMLDPTKDMERAEVMIEKAEDKLNELRHSSASSVITTRIPTFRRSTGSSHIVRRFGCEICNHYFGKKFNLDRHNQSIHMRETPDNFPTHAKYPYKGPTSKQKRRSHHVSCTMSSIAIKRSPTPSPLLPPVKVPSTPPSASPMKSKGKVRCNFCRKMFKKSSISRHVVIHSGNKAHKCDQCPMAFFQKSDLSRHLVSI